MNFIRKINTKPTGPFSDFELHVVFNQCWSKSFSSNNYWASSWLSSITWSYAMSWSEAWSMSWDKSIFWAK